jgi:hypothetical protein
MSRQSRICSAVRVALACAVISLYGLGAETASAFTDPTGLGLVNELGDASHPGLSGITVDVPEGRAMRDTCQEPFDKSGQACAAARALDALTPSDRGAVPTRSSDTGLDQRLR